MLLILDQKKFFYHKVYRARKKESVLMEYNLNRSLFSFKRALIRDSLINNLKKICHKFYSNNMLWFYFELLI